MQNGVVNEHELPDGRIFVGGEFRTGRGAEIVSLFPADGSINRIFRGASDEDVTLAIARAHEALATSGWQQCLPHERAARLYAIADGIARNAGRISYIQTRDTGKTLRETHALAMSAAGSFRYFAAALETMEEAITPPRGPYMTLSCHEPIGIVSAITPWNSPIASDAQKVAPALAAGNAVLLKPASWSPLVSLEFARIVHEAGLPAGLLSVLPGSGRVVGERLVRDPAIGRISFTGGTGVGHGIARHAAERMIPVSLELGGKSPTIVFPDADMKQAVAGILYGIFSSSGQSCVAGSRLFVHDSIYDEFIGHLVAATRALKVGHPFDPQTQVAPLVHADHLREVENWVGIAREDGGKVLVGGARPDQHSGLEGGYYYLPTIVEGLPNNSRLCREEVFGPVLAVQRFSSEEDMVALANDNQYALACGIWTRDVVHALKLGRRITTGTVWINTYKQFSVSTPFGGEKESGMGREKGLEGLRAYMKQKSYYIDMAQTPLPWAAIS